MCRNRKCVRKWGRQGGVLSKMHSESWVGNNLFPSVPAGLRHPCATAPVFSIHIFPSVWSPPSPSIGFYIVPRGGHISSRINPYRLLDFAHRSSMHHCVPAFLEIDLAIPAAFPSLRSIIMRNHDGRTRRMSLPPSSVSRPSGLSNRSCFRPFRGVPSFSSTPNERRSGTERPDRPRTDGMPRTGIIQTHEIALEL
ncbi:hypothetical protein SEA_HUWBERT_116 [Microbacterium phage Huwbert]|nr:hypothetical protein SEA_HUWBERT_8 [Microbacterium phage Huwbert]WNO27870.1 hypothetical protein SEA_HUWBERT_116 [Microbacterium phage Huwbert]